MIFCYLFTRKKSIEKLKAKILYLWSFPLIYISFLKVEYQKVSCFRRNGIIDECSHDIVPFYRPQLWAALLQIDFDTQYKYQQIDKVGFEDLIKDGIEAVT